MGSDLQNIQEICVFLYPTPLGLQPSEVDPGISGFGVVGFGVGSNFFIKKKFNFSRSGFPWLILVLFLLLDDVSFTGDVNFCF